MYFCGGRFPEFPAGVLVQGTGTLLRVGLKGTQNRFLRSPSMLPFSKGKCEDSWLAVFPFVKGNFQQAVCPFFANLLDVCLLLVSKELVGVARILWMAPNTWFRLGFQGWLSLHLMW